MMTRGRLAVSLSFGVLLAGCGPESPTGMSTPTDLTGTYSLVEQSRDGLTLTLPMVAGTLVLKETSRSAFAAAGTWDLDITIPTGRIVDRGRYRITDTGAWMQTSSISPETATGRVELRDLQLILEVTAPVSAMARTVWIAAFIAASES